MVRKLELDALKSDLVGLRRLLSKRTPESDPIGYLQYSSRIQELEEQVGLLDQNPPQKASIALLFSGDPVQGSRGIGASFAGKAVNLFQELVSKQFANLEQGIMAPVGPVPFRGSSDLLVTDVARGSFGVVLEEADRNESLTNSELQVAVHKVAEDIKQTAQTDATAFEEFVGDVDSRYFSALGQLFKLLDDSKATIRMVDHDQEIELDSQSVHRGRERTDMTIVDDDDGIRVPGHLYLLPEARKFELKILGSDETIIGNVAKEFVTEHLKSFSADSVINKDWVVRLKVRTITKPSRPPQIKHTLLGLVESISSH